MSEVLAVVVTFPGVVPTVLLGVVMVYWLFVLLGMVDVDLFGGEGALEGASKGMIDGLADGALHGAAKGVTEGVADGALKGVLEDVTGSSKAVGGLDGAGHGALAVLDLMSIANFRSVPVTVMLSLVACFGWLFCVVATGLWQGYAISLPIPWWITGAVILALSYLVALVPTATVIRPMSRFFVTHPARRHAELVGRICTITTGRVDEKFGQALLDTEGMSLLIQVRTDDSSSLKKGKTALIVSWNAQRAAFLVEPYDELING